MCKLRWIEIARREVEGDRSTNRSHDWLARQRGLEQLHLLSCKHTCRTHSVVNLEVIGMPISTRRVVADDDIGGLLIDNCGKDFSYSEH